MSGFDGIGSHRDCGRLLSDEASFLARKFFFPAQRNDYEVVVFTDFAQARLASSQY